MSDTRPERKKLSDIFGNDAKDVLNVWSQTEPAPDDAPLPRGIYIARVIKGELIRSTQGTRGYGLTFQVLEGLHAGRLVWTDRWLTQLAMPRTKRDLAKLGITDPEQLTQPLPFGIRAELTVVVHTADDGIPRNKVSAFQVIGTDPPETDPFAPAPPIPPAPPVSTGAVDATAGTTATSPFHDEQPPLTLEARA